MVKSQQWINENFPNREEKEKVKKLYIKNDQGIDSISGQSYYFYKVQLEGELNLSEFANLNYLDVRGSSFGVGTYQRLTKLDLNNCSKLENIYVDYNDGQLAIEGGSTLNSIHLENCQNLVDFQISNSLTNLKKLNVKHCDKLVRISDLNKLVNLKEFSLYKCLNLTDLNGLNKLTNLTSISVKGSKLTSLELAYLDKLSNFSLDRSYGSGGNPWLTSVSLTNLNALTSLSIEDCPQLTNLKLIHLDNLTSLKLNSNDYCSSCCPQLGKIEGLEKLKKISKLTLKNCPQLSQPDFKSMSSLRKLTISGCSNFACQPEDFPGKLTNLSFNSQKFSTYNLENLVAKEVLTDLSFSSCSNLKELSNLGKLRKLNNLYLHELKNLIDLKGAGDLNNLTKLTIKSCSNLEKVEGLEKLVKLGQFSFQECPKLKIFTPFEEWKKSLESKIKEVGESEIKIKGLEAEKLEIKNGKLEIEQKLRDFEEKNSELEKEKNDTRLELIKQTRELEDKIKELEEKQLNENEKSILRKLGELFKFFDNQFDGENVAELERLIKECEEFNFIDAPNLPDNFKLESKGLIKRANSLAECYHDLQLAKEEAEKLKVENQKKEEESREKIEKLNQEIKDLNSKIEKELVDNSEQEKQMVELWGDLERLRNDKNSQIVSLQKQLDGVQTETSQLIEKSKKDTAEAVQTEQRRFLEAEQKLTAQIMTNKVQEQSIGRLKEREKELEKEIENIKEKIIQELKEKGLETIELSLKNTLKNTSTLKSNNTNTKYNIMVRKNISNNKTFILEWEKRGLKDRTMPYEEFKVIVGSDKESLVFYSTFFDDEVNAGFKKGEIYELSITGEFVQDSSEIIQGISEGGYEFEEISPSLVIKELWEEKEENFENLGLLEEDIERRKKDVDKINKSWLDAREEVTELKKQLKDLRLEKEEITQRLNKLENELLIEKEGTKKTAQLEEQLKELQLEKNKIENEWATPESHEKALREKETLKDQLKTARKNKQILAIKLEKIINQKLNKTIQTKLKDAKEEQEQLRIGVNSRLDAAQQVYLKMLLASQGHLDGLIFGGAEERFQAPIKNQLQSAKEELITKVSTEEIEKLCEMQTEITKLEEQRKQWEKMEEQQQSQAKEEQFEAHVGVPPK